LGKEAALFVASGTMRNLVALMNFDEGESMSHHYRHTKADTLDKLDISSLREYAWEITLLLSTILQNIF